MVRYRGVLRVLVVGCLTFALSTFVLAQAPASRDATAQTPEYADMLQVMRAVLYPAANVIFTAQTEDPAAFEPAARMSTCPSRIRCQAATGSWTKSRQWETQRTLFSSAWATMCPPTKVDGVWPFNDAWLRTSL